MGVAGLHRSTENDLNLIFSLATIGRSTLSPSIKQIDSCYCRCSIRLRHLRYIRSASATCCSFTENRFSLLSLLDQAPVSSPCSSLFSNTISPLVSFLYYPDFFKFINFDIPISPDFPKLALITRCVHRYTSSERSGKATRLDTSFLYMERLLEGFGVGTISYTVPVYVAEIAPQNMTGTLPCLTLIPRESA
ncbi:hypothetical protein LXL04_024803 [Taraxacum kok-saghyz]